MINKDLMFSKVYNYDPSTPVYSVYFFICIFVTVTYITHKLLLFNLLKPYNASCIEMNSKILMDLIIFLCISDE